MLDNKLRISLSFVAKVVTLHAARSTLQKERGNYLKGNFSLLPGRFICPLISPVTCMALNNCKLILDIAIVNK